ncbi:hypothetical protein ABPG72_008187 [Tetrahymena utriculariae]
MNTEIENLLSIFKESLLQDNTEENLEDIYVQLKKIEKKIKPLEEEETTLILFGYYKYVLAKICLESGKFPQKNKKYESHLRNYLNDYEEYSQSVLDCNKDLEENEEIIDPQNYFLVLGETGVGKSSFIKNLTQSREIQVSGGMDSHTSECSIQKNYIDTPGINDTNMSIYETLLIIARFLHTKQIQISNIFIILIQNKQLNQNKILREFSFVYFLYELFGQNINAYEIKFLIKEYNESSYLLNWFEQGLFHKEDEFSQKRQLIFKNKDKAANYFELIMSYHIRVLTFFDKIEPENLKTLKKNRIEKLREQIWSDKYQEDLFYAYKNHIKNQKASLLSKIKEIKKLEAFNRSFDEKQDFQYILLIGPSQVGKSAIIEQLTNQLYLRGSGEYSFTKICSIYRVDHDYITYKFIDTPGFSGNEDNQTTFHNFKIIADFVRRNQINEFKLLIMKDYEKQIRDTNKNILSEFFMFVTQVLDQDISFIDRQYLKLLLNGQDAQFELESFTNKSLFYDKVLQIFRSSQNRQDADRNEFLQYVFFKSNFIADDGQIVKVPQQEDKEQQNKLFKKINEIDQVSVETKVMLKIKQSLAQGIISTVKQFNENFNRTAEKYKNLNDSFTEIEKITANGSASMNQDIFQQFQSIKLNLIKELKTIQFSVLGVIYQEASVNIQNSKYSNQIINDTLKHFLPIQYTPLLFEITDSFPQSVLLSRKQHYYSLFAHQLSKFVDINNNEHVNKLEELAEIKLAQEICYHQNEHQKIIEQNYNNSAKENINKLDKLSKNINLLFGYGISSYKHMAYISIFLKSFNLLPFSTSIIWADLVLAPLRVGIDLYQNYKGYISKKQFALNSTINVSSGSITLSMLFFSASSLAWVALASAGLLVLLGYGFSSIMFTSKLTYDTTIGRALNHIMEDNHPNQQLRYYEIAKLFKKLNLTNYSQVNQKEGYNMFRKLEINQFNSKKQFLLLQQLFKPNQDQNLRDLITNYIVKNYICKQIVQEEEFDQKRDEDNQIYLNRVLQQLQQNIKIIKTYYNKSSLIEKFIYHSEQIQKLIQEKLKQELALKQANILIYSGLELANNEKQLMINYKKQVRIFYESLQNNQTTYSNQVEQSSGAFRLDGRFQILFNSYCNLTELKIEQKLQQPTIKQITKNESQMKFILANNNNQYEQENSIFQKKDNKQLVEQLNMLCMTDKYIVNRYLQKIKETDKPNLTCIAGDEVIEADLEYSLDLHQIIEEQKFKTSNMFINYIKQQLIEKSKNSKKQNEEQQIKSQENIINQLLGDGQEIKKRLQYFYQSVEYLKNYFN